MNIALSAVIISILLIPPIIFYLSLFLGKYQRAIPSFSLFESILAAAVLSLFIHAAAINFIPYEIRFDILNKLLGGEMKDLEKKVSNHEFNEAIKSFACYNFVLVVIMISLGRICRFVLILTKWHAKSPLLNLYNKWWYLFNGYYSNVEAYDVIFVDVVVDTKDCTVIYSGFLEHFDFNNGELERLYLKDTLRRDFAVKGDNITANQSNSHEIPGDTFSLAYKNILNINLHFITIDNTLEEIQDIPDDGSIE